MKKSILILLLISFSILNAKNELIVKFKSHSNLDISVLRTTNNYVFEDFNKILGKYIVSPYISNEIISWLRKYENNEQKYVNPNNIRDLQNIFKVKYSNELAPEIAVSKLKNLDYIEYIEVSPEHKIFAETNDSLIADCYYIDNVKAENAWKYINSNDTVLVGVIDTGVDIYHEDLSSNIYKNPGESGIDDFGKDKSSNGIDDDLNGFIDDINGWDFVSSDSIGQDNHPVPGNEHGTHVAGTIGAIINNFKGVAGVAKNVKILPVKIAGDSPWAGSVENSYEGLLYASLAGAKIINCSWGSGTRSQAEQEVINTITNLGSLIVAAAGNNSSMEAFYPAAYNGVLSVAAVNNFDAKAGFSNYDNSVDVSAPGHFILSTIPNNEYSYMSGTSMASPVAAGVCALTKLAFPDYSPIQIAEQVKANCDNIDSINPTFIGLLGLGRVNAFNSVSNNNSKSVVISSYEVSEENHNTIYEENEEISIVISIKNVLSKIDSVYVKLSLDTKYQNELILDSLFIESIEKDAEFLFVNPFKFKMTDKLPLDYSLPVEINAYHNNKLINRIKFYINFNPSYKTMNYNDLAVTFNSVGNFAFNDYPHNNQGDGFKYQESKNMLFEGGLMIGINQLMVANCIRGELQASKDKSFSSSDAFSIKKSTLDSLSIGNAIFNDKSDLIKTDINVVQRVYQSNSTDMKDFIIVHYDIKNNSGYDYDSLYAGLFFDWDIGFSSGSNYVDFDEESKIGYCYSTRDTTSPYSGVIMLNDYNLNYFAIDNDGSSDENPGIYDGFTINEKWKTLSSGLSRLKSSVTDASQVISAGPLKLLKNEMITVSFAIMGGANLESLVASAKIAKEAFKLTNIEVFHNVDKLIHIFPNPSSNLVKINYSGLHNVFIISESGELYDKCYNVENNVNIDLSNYLSGNYFVKVVDKSSGKIYFEKFSVIK